ncbi:MAG TPA: glycosyltransferase family 4 protein [Polyangiaceae bacterium]|nr:glycosyltransferase family 4 protein [Polyangiaceae bacterium]
MNIALLCPYLPAPAHSGGRIRIHRLAAALARLGEVSLFASAGQSDLDQHRNDPGLSLFTRTHLAHTAFSWLSSNGVPARVRRCASTSLKHALLRSHAERPFSVVVVEHAQAASLACDLGVPWVLDEHNVESEYLRERLRAQGRLVEVVARREIAALQRWEQRCWRAATRVTCVSEADAAEIARQSGRRPTVIPNGISLREIRFILPSHRRGYEIAFIGLMGHAPNAAAARFLAREVLPRVQRVEPRARLTLCGADPTAAVRALAGPDVEVTGRVASVNPYLERAAVYANPLQHGAGTSLKVLEALAAGTPLVSSESGVRGFALEAPRHFLAAESAEQFAGQILSCFRDRGSRDGAARAGRNFAEAHDFATIGESFAAVIVDAVRTRGPDQREAT